MNSAFTDAMLSNNRHVAVIELTEYIIADMMHSEGIDKQTPAAISSRAVRIAILTVDELYNSLQRESPFFTKATAP